MSIQCAFRATFVAPVAIWLAGSIFCAAQSNKDQAPKAKKASISGRVVDLAGAPVAKARVSAEASTSEAGQSARSYMSGTAADGTFALEGLDTGSYQIVVERWGYLREVFEKPGAGANGTWIPVTPGQEIGDIVVHLTPEAVLTGRVLDEDHDPVPNVSVRLYGYTYTLGLRRAETIALGETDTTGAFRLTGISAGRYYIVAMPRRTSIESSTLPSGKRIQYRSIPTYYGGSAEASAAQQIAVSPGESAPVGDLILRKAPIVHIRGRVNGEASSGTTGGRIVVRVAADDDGSAVGPLDAPTAVVSAKDGTFDVVDATPGRYILVVTNSSGPIKTLARESLSVGDTDADDVMVTLLAGEITGSFVYAGSKSVPDTSQEKTPAVKANPALPVVVLLADGPEAIGSPGQRVRNDSFHFRDVGPGRYRVRVSSLPPDVYLQSIRSADGEDLLTTDLDLTRGGHRAITFTLSRSPASLEGSVVDDDGKPVPNVIVTSTPKTPDTRQAHRYLRAMSDENGHFTIHGLAPGEYCLYTWRALADGEEFDHDLLQREGQRCTAVELQEDGSQRVQLIFRPAKAQGQ